MMSSIARFSIIENETLRIKHYESVHKNHIDFFTFCFALITPINMNTIHTNRVKFPLKVIDNCKT